jgi:hypothetical protein
VGVVGDTCNPSTEEAAAGGLQVQDQPGLHSESLSQKQITWRSDKIQKPLEVSTAVEIFLLGV